MFLFKISAASARARLQPRDRVMASVLNNVRGTCTRETCYASMLPDHEYQGYMDHVRALKPKEQRRWKAATERSDGSLSTIRFDERGLYAMWLNQRVDVYARSDWPALQDRATPTTPVVFEKRCATDEDHVAHIGTREAETATGNHTRRNHPIVVPTRSGEPVRG